MKFRITLVAGLLMLAPFAAFGQEAAPTPGADAASPAAVQPAPDASGVYRVGNGVSAPRAISNVNPEFSDEARRKKVSGTCVVSVVVDKRGMPRDVRIFRSVADGVPDKLRSTARTLDKKAIEAVKQYRFAPATFQGEPVPVEIKVEVSFRFY